jgi:hypothetical protein
LSFLLYRTVAGEGVGVIRGWKSAFTGPTRSRPKGKLYVTIPQVIEIREYLGRDGRNLFGDWFARLNSEAARRVTTALYRVGMGSFSNVKGCWRRSL